MHRRYPMENKHDNLGRSGKKVIKIKVGAYDAEYIRRYLKNERREKNRIKNKYFKKFNVKLVNDESKKYEEIEIEEKIIKYNENEEKIIKYNEIQIQEKKIMEREKLEKCAAEGMVNFIRDIHFKK
ncbi:hypothetical protein SLOPH_1001 [Spraguea lophii 42_110]|uniref:Uncharacterized protein n=1 Tax=Spraguea lophii (strain 42_110) TaxID=1358809 RepID=S7XII4_SPRLO|nr:hypothetical protein SLOPH_1001 [Spraguea lophii 42_110]